MIEAEDKRYARVRVVEILCDAIVDGMAKRGFVVPDPPVRRRSK